jgi:hypothetical protein
MAAAPEVVMDRQERNQGGLSLSPPFISFSPDVETHNNSNNNNSTESY